MTRTITTSSRNVQEQVVKRSSCSGWSVGRCVQRTRLRRDPSARSAHKAVRDLTSNRPRLPLDEHDDRVSVDAVVLHGLAGNFGRHRLLERGHVRHLQYHPGPLRPAGFDECPDRDAVGSKNSSRFGELSQCSTSSTSWNAMTVAMVSPRAVPPDIPMRRRVGSALLLPLPAHAAYRNDSMRGRWCPAPRSAHGVGHAATLGKSRESGDPPSGRTPHGNQRTPRGGMKARPTRRSPGTTRSLGIIRRPRHARPPACEPAAGTPRRFASVRPRCRLRS